MNIELQKEFLAKWEQYFKGAELPFVFFYSDDDKYEEFLVGKKGFACMVAQIAPVLKGRTVAFSAGTISCKSGIRASGFPAEYSDDFRYFLSCGKNGESEGLRLKKTPAMVDAYMKTSPDAEAQGKYIIFKRWDRVEEGEDPEVVIFYSSPDVLSGLYCLFGFDSSDRFGVIAPFSSGCGSIINFPLKEQRSSEQRAVIGMFDISARPGVPENTLSFALPMERFRIMIQDMDESFLSTGHWRRLLQRIGRKP